MRHSILAMRKNGPLPMSRGGCIAAASHKGHVAPFKTSSSCLPDYNGITSEPGIYVNDDDTLILSLSLNVLNDRTEIVCYSISDNNRTTECA